MRDTELRKGARVKSFRKSLQLLNQIFKLAGNRPAVRIQNVTIQWLRYYRARLRVIFVGSALLLAVLALFLVARRAWLQWELGRTTARRANAVPGQQCPSTRYHWHHYQKPALGCGWVAVVAGVVLARDRTARLGGQGLGLWSYVSWPQHSQQAVLFPGHSTAKFSDWPELFGHKLA